MYTNETGIRWDDGDGWRPLAAATTATDSASLHLLQLGLQLLDLGMCLLEILVKAITLSDEFLFPLPEALLLNLDLLGKALAESLLLLLELGVVELSRAGLAKFASLHLLSTVRLVVELLGCVDQVQHMGADQDRPELLEIAVVLILDLSDAPRVLTALDDAPITGLHILLRADNSEGHRRHQAPGVLSGSLIILLNWRLVNLDALSLNDSTDLELRVSMTEEV